MMIYVRTTKSLLILSGGCCCSTKLKAVKSRGSTEYVIKTASERDAFCCLAILLRMTVAAREFDSSLTEQRLNVTWT